MARNRSEETPIADKTEEQDTPVVNDGLVVMVKIGKDDIRVHPDQIAGWEAVGWQVVQ